MKDDEITVWLQQFSLEQLDHIKQLVASRATEKARQREAQRRQESSRPLRATAGMPPTPPKDVAALAEAADLDISGLLRDIDRRKR
jgi:hypothetical protein